MCYWKWIFKRNSTVILMSMTVAIIVVTERTFRKLSINERQLSTTISPKISTSYENIRQHAKNDDVVMHNSLSTEITQSTCDVNFVPTEFANTEDQYETYFVDQKEIYSRKYLQPPIKVKALYQNATIRLHPDRFLYPVLFRGPNNQLIGLRESIYIAIRLNRTLVIPRFQKHRTDQQLSNGNSIHPAHRIDLTRLCTFVSCITSKQFRQACGNKADVIMRLRRYSPNSITIMESLSGLRFSQVDDVKLKSFNFLPKPKTKDDKEIVYFGPGENEIKALFDSQDRCAIYAQPFFNLKIKQKPSNKRLTSTRDLRSCTNEEIFSEIIRRTESPSYIQNLAEEFIKFAFDRHSFLAIHWRYDKDDWMKRCNDLTGNVDRRQHCDETSKISSSDVAKAIINKAMSLEVEVNNIYIAVPTSQEKFADDIKSLLTNKKFSVYNLKDVNQFLQSEFRSCDFLRRHKGDIDSTIEMQICRKSTVFMKSPRSSWSNNVAEWRRHGRAPGGSNPASDEDIFGPARKIMVDRINSTLEENRYVI